MPANIESIDNHRNTVNWTSFDDNRLMAAVSQGNKGAFTALVTRHISAIVRFAKRYVGYAADAEDVAQETFIRLWKHAINWEEQGYSLRSWLYRITYNLCIDQLRKRKQTTPIEAEQLFSADDAPDEVLVRRQQQNEIMQALNRLPERQRSAILLCNYQGLTNIEAAMTMEISVEALESLLSRGRRTLKSMLLETNHDQGLNL